MGLVAGRPEHGSLYDSLPCLTRRTEVSICAVFAPGQLSASTNALGAL